MSELPNTAAEAGHDAELDDALEREEAQLLGEPTAGDFEANAAVREAEERETLDILDGLRKLAQGDSVRWQIWRVDGPDPFKNGFLANWSTTMLTQERLRDEFGAGVYKIEGTRSNGKYLRRRTITIAEDAPRSVREPKMNAMTSQSGGFNLAEFMAQQETRETQRRREDQERDERRETREREREEKQERQRADRQAFILAALPSAATVLAAMFGNRTDPLAIAAALRPAPGPDPLQMIAALKQLAPEPVRGPDPMSSALQLFEVLADKAGSNAGRTDWLDVVKEGVKIMGPSVGGAIEHTINQARENAAKAQNATEPPPMEVTDATDSAALPAPAPGDDSMLDLLPHVGFLRTQLAKLAGAAERNRDPALYAAMFLEELPKGFTPQRLHLLLSKADWFQQLQRFDARISGQAQWWSDLRMALLDYIQDATAPAAVQPAQPTPKRTGQPADIVRPTVLPSLTGEIDS